MSDHHSSHAIKKLLDKVPKERRLRAAAMLAPIVGASIAEMIPTGDVQKILQAMREITEEQTERVLNQLRHIAQVDGVSNRGPIAVVGSGNLEMLLHSPTSQKIIIGEKHAVKVESLWGGSGVNFSTRLLSAGRLVLPVLPIAQDHAGERIVRALDSAAREGGIYDDVKPLWHNMALFNNEVNTPTTVLIVHGSERSAFRQQAETKAGYLDQMKHQIDQLWSLCNAPSALMVGHVPRGGESIDATAKVVDHLLDRYRNRTLIYTVLGSSQLRLGWKHWEKHIRDNIDVFQLSLSEAKLFFSNNGSPATIYDIIDHFKKIGVSAVLTMDKFGAIALHSKSDHIYVVWPLLNTPDVEDSTGAGDAFAAGMVSVLADVGPDFSSHDFVRGLTEGSRWAGAACLTQGGAGRSPGKELSTFVENNSCCWHNNVETRQHQNLQELLTFVDLAYQ